MAPHKSSHRSREERRSRSRSRHDSRSRHRGHRDERKKERADANRESFHRELEGSFTRSSSKGSQPSSSMSRESDIARLAEVLSGMVKTGSKVRSNYINEKVLPEYDPELKNFSAADWVEKVDTCGEMYDWDSKTKLYLALLKLKGNAKLWYEGLENALLTWEVFSIAITRQFPGEINFGKLMEEAVNYKSSPGEDLQKYCFIKLGKINKLKLDLTEDKIVDIIAQGLHDESVRTIVLAARNKTIADLNKCLSIFINKNKNQLLSKDSKDLKNHKSFKRPYTSSEEGEKSKSKSSNKCYLCGKEGHIKRFCPESGETSKKNHESEPKGSDQLKKSNKAEKNKKKCNFCKMPGHLEAECYKLKNLKEKKEKKEETA